MLDLAAVTEINVIVLLSFLCVLELYSGVQFFVLNAKMIFFIIIILPSLLVFQMV
jgi:hypothetical protein